MLGPQVLVIALTANELGSTHTAAVLRSAREVLGPNVSVRVEVIDEGSKHSASADFRPNSAYAWLSWDQDSPSAHLRCYLPQSGRWVQRDVSFAEQDPEAERGRTLGFVIASIFVEQSEPLSSPVVSAPSKPPKQAVGRLKPFELGAAAAAVFPGDVMSLGGWVSAQRNLTRRLSLGVAGEARFGAVNQASAGSRFYAFGAVSTLRVWPSTGSAWLGIRTFGGTETIAITHKSEDDPTPVTHSSWVPRLDLLLHGSLELGSSVVFLDVGTNYRFGSTDIYVREYRRAHFSPFVGVARVGVGARF